MIWEGNPVELLAPAGNWEALEAAVEAGADAVYLGGKAFNMRLHRQDMNFDDEALARAVTYAHAHQVRLYITINNLISEEEIEPLRRYLLYLNEIRPDAILVQDFAVISLAEELGMSLPLHASVMMNIHNEAAMRLLKEHGITRIVASREMTLAELALLRQTTGLEIEYFVHGDMCISESGQCVHSGVLFGQSGNRGRCLKPCRWPYEIIDEITGESLENTAAGPYKLALKDMCLYRNLPELIQSGVYSFKIEGRMRPADFVHRIVGTYRRAIDAYLADPAGYRVNAEDWQDLYENRARDFTTSFALGQPTAEAIGWDGTREPRFFSKASPEASLDPHLLADEPAISPKKTTPYPFLTVHAADLNGVSAACENGADAVIIGGETWRPRRPWTLDDIRRALRLTREYGVRTIIDTPRSTHQRECRELSQFFLTLEEMGPDALLVGNPGILKLAAECATLPIHADFSFNLFNHRAAAFLKEQRVSLGTVSLELAFPQLRDLVQHTSLPLEIILHGVTESMICDHNLPALVLGNYDPLENPSFNDRRYALRDEAEEIHPLRQDQYGRFHILFAKDLCLYPYLSKLKGFSSYRIEGQDYAPYLLGKITRLYREALDSLAAGKEPLDLDALAALQNDSPRTFGCGTYRFHLSR